MTESKEVQFESSFELCVSTVCVLFRNDNVVNFMKKRNLYKLAYVYLNIYNDTRYVNTITCNFFALKLYRSIKFLRFSF